MSIINSHLDYKPERSPPVSMIASGFWLKITCDSTIPVVFTLINTTSSIVGVHCVVIQVGAFSKYLVPCRLDHNHSK